LKRLRAILRGLAALALLVVALLLISDTLEGHLWVWSFVAVTLLVLGWLARRQRRRRGDRG
jgi:MYXO-CTERM domain-containing protein